MGITERLALLITTDATNAIKGVEKLGQTSERSLSLLDKLKAGFAIGVGLEGAKQGVEKLGQGLSKLAQFGIDSARAAEDDARAQALLASTIHNTTSATTAQIAGTDSYITKLSLASTVADDQLRPALATLVRSTGDLTSAQRLLGLSLDVSAGTGADLGTVSDSLAKALQGNTKGLRSLTPELGKLIKDGASASEILAKLTDTYRGQAAEFAANNSFGKLSVAVDEAKETIGKAFLPILQTAADVVGNDLGPALEDIAPLLAAAAAYAKALAAGLGYVADGVKLITDLIPDFLKGSGDTSKKLFDAVQPTVTYADAVGFLGANLDKMPPFFRAAAQAALGTDSSLKILGLDVEGLDAKLAALDFGNVGSTLFGVARAQDSFHKSLEDTSKAAGSAATTAKEYERKLRSVDDATRSLADANQALNEAQLNRFFVALGSSADDVTSAQIAERDSTRALADAQRSLGDAQKRLNDLRNVDKAGLLDAEAAYIQAQRDFIDAEKTSDVVAIDRAKANLIRTEKALSDARNPSSSEDYAKAQQDVEAAQDRVTQAGIDQRKAHEDLNVAINAGRDGSRELTEANKKLADAQRGVDDAARTLADSQDALNEKITAVAGATQTASEKFYAGTDAAAVWLQKLKDEKATPQEFALALNEIESSLGKVAAAAGKTAELDDYLNKLAIMAYAIAGLNGQLDAVKPKLGFIDTSAQKPGTPYLYGGASPALASEFSVTLRLKGDAVVDSLLDYQSKNGSIPIRVTG